MEANGSKLPELEVLIIICAGYITAGKPFSEQLLIDIKEKLDEYFDESQSTLH
tara:strand:- start:505 stop:663 length:159 start_codon:yes stop_codon:yes gene_type:complete